MVTLNSSKTDKLEPAQKRHSFTKWTTLAVLYVYDSLRRTGSFQPFVQDCRFSISVSRFSSGALIISGSSFLSI